MASFPSRGHSLWMDESSKVSYQPLDKDLSVDVVIIGGGIAGLSAAYMLKQRGKTVAVLEKHVIGAGVSGYTTAKVTSQHGITYSQQLSKFGEGDTRLYGEANQAALEQIEAIIRKEQIDCDWQRSDNYVFTQDQTEVSKLQQEAGDAAKLGLPAPFVTHTPLPFTVEGAVKFENQASFHIVKYLHGLAKAIHGKGSYVFERTKGDAWEDRQGCKARARGFTISATDMIMATNVPGPYLDHAAYGIYEYPLRSYIVAGKLAPEHDLSGMYISSDSPTRSILPITLEGERWLLVGGEGHFGGVGGPAAPRYGRLAEYAKEHFGVTPTYKWSTWDFIAYDNKPLIGKLYPWSKHMYVATGFKKWGMTTSMVAAMILTDALQGKENPWAHTFRSNRISAIASLPQGLSQGFGILK